MSLNPKLKPSFVIISQNATPTQIEFIPNKSDLPSMNLYHTAAASSQSSFVGKFKQSDVPTRKRSDICERERKKKLWWRRRSFSGKEQDSIKLGCCVNSKAIIVCRQKFCDFFCSLQAVERRKTFFRSSGCVWLSLCICHKQSPCVFYGNVCVHQLRKTETYLFFLDKIYLEQSIHQIIEKLKCASVVLFKQNQKWSFS